jgi:hypothetical protein
MYANWRSNPEREKCDKETEKILKYEDLITEIQRIWNIKT